MKRDDVRGATRRRFLRALGGVGGAVGVAGCGGLVGDEGASPTRDEPGPSPTTEEPRTPTSTDGAPDTPAVYAGFLDGEEVAAIRRQVRANREPWSSGYEAQIRDARRALDATPRSVVDNGAPDGVDDNRFATSEKRTDYQAAIRMSTWIRDLGLAYAFSENDAFARKAIDLIHHWFLAPETRMYPSGRNFGETYFSIELHITIPTMVYGASFVRDHPYWQRVEADETALQEWVGAYLTDLEDGRGEDRYTGVIKNNIYAWWILARAVAASYLDDPDSLRSAFDDWRGGALEQIGPDDLLTYERQRVDGLAYSLYGLKALTLTAEIARHYGVDLYGYRFSGERDQSALEAVFSGYAEYVENSDDWQWGLGEEGFTQAERMAGGSIYELAYSVWPRADFESVIATVGRPLYERRVLGWTTLTHANRFALGLQ